MRKLWLTELSDCQIHRAVEWRAVIKIEVCGIKATFSSLQCTMGSNEITSRLRQQTKCELSLHPYIKDCLSKQIPRNH